jgi:hypothetical protein
MLPTFRKHKSNSCTITIKDSTVIVTGHRPKHRASAQGKNIGQGYRARAQGKGTGQGHRARAQGKGTGQGHRAQGKGTGQGHRARAQGKGTGQGHRVWYYLLIENKSQICMLSGLYVEMSVLFMIVLIMND